MVRQLNSAALMFFALAAGAQGEPCAKLEFAELDSMPKEELLQMRCDYERQFLAGYMRCSDEVSRMDRVIARKYQLKNKGDPDLPYYVEINGLCRK